MRRIEELGIEPIDIVVVNLYPFKQTIQKPGVSFEEAIENIDIGGPSMLRAAAKNHASVTVVVDVNDYARVTEEIRAHGDTLPETRLELCAKVFAHNGGVRRADRAVSGRKSGYGPVQRYVHAHIRKGAGHALRREPAPERGVLPRDRFSPRVPGPRPCSSTEKSFRTTTSMTRTARWNCCTSSATKRRLSRSSTRNPCGVGLAPTLIEAYTKAYEADPVSIFGGIVATNVTVDEETAQKMHEIFLEIVIAPDYSPEALAVLTKKKNIRLLKLPTINAPIPAGMLDMKKVRGGLLVQTIDDKIFEESDWKVVTKAQPTQEQIENAIMAFKVNKHIKSNGIAVCKGGKSLGIGAGQVNRIWAAEQALERSGEAVKGASMASDAYFPFPDCVEAAAKAGIACIIQPGGSKKRLSEYRSLRRATASA